jgi:hypothetical protein
MNMERTLMFSGQTEILLGFQDNIFLKVQVVDVAS